MAEMEERMRKVENMYERRLRNEVRLLAPYAPYFSDDSAL